MWIWGNGGHAKVVRQNLPSYVKIIDGNDPAFPWNDEYLEEDGLVAIGDNRTRREIVSKFQFRPVRWMASVIDPAASVRTEKGVGKGTVVMAGAVIQPDAFVGDHCIVNSNAVIEHDCMVYSFVHIAPAATLCGGVEVGTGTLVGAGTVVTPGVQIGAWLTIPAGSVVTKDCLNEEDVAQLRRR